MSSQGLHHQQSQRQTQGLVLTPQLRQSLRILQIPAAELIQDINAELAINPLLEEVPPDELPAPTFQNNDTPDPHAAAAATDAYGDTDDAESAPTPARLTTRDNAENDDYGDAIQKMDEDRRDDLYDDSRTLNPREPADDDEYRQHLFDTAPQAAPSLETHLLEQARTAAPTPAILAAIETLIGELDERGFMATDLGTLSLQTNHTRQELETAWKLLKTFDPHGIAARDLRECLLNQLLLTRRRHTLAALILDECYPLLLKRRIPEITRALDTTPDAVRDAFTILAKLETSPARNFERDENRILNPDIIIRRAPDGEWDVVLNNEVLPRLRLNQSYKSLLGSKTLKPGDREYISERLRAGRFFIGAIEQRQQTLARIAHLVVKYQPDFLEKGPTQLRPLTMAQLARELDVHETTVSRAIANKSVLTPYGVRELRYFFTSGLATDTGEALANSSIRHVLAKVIADENPIAPYSDEALVAELKKRGIQIARRTIAKYRAARNIPSAHMRRRH